MEALVVYSPLTIQSQKGPYSVHFEQEFPGTIQSLVDQNSFFIVDENIARIYHEKLRPILASSNTILIEATEFKKSLNEVGRVIDRLVVGNVRRNQLLVAVGGGITQDMTCFISSILLRGIPWAFIPTTLLSQADSCIGSKSSINTDGAKNILGTFNPQSNIYIWRDFLMSLKREEIISGIGEIIKVHAIASIDAFDELAHDYDRMLVDSTMLTEYTKRALQIKQKFIEIDEFDQGIRNIFNYGHSFGHAIEAATHFSIPHGVAVTMGMDMANFIAYKRGLISEKDLERMHRLLKKNYSLFCKVKIPIDPLLAALMKDKKNVANQLRLILPVGENVEMRIVEVAPDEIFQHQCQEFLKAMH
jgi:3-dehydroquinate synthase